MPVFQVYSVAAANSSIDSESRLTAMADGDDLDALGINTVLLRPRPQIFRLLVELRNRDALWKAGKAGEGRLPGVLPLSRLEASQREISLQLTEELFEAGCATEDGSLTIVLPGLVEEEPIQFFITTQGPRGSPYEGGVFKMKFELPLDWPKRPPRVRFLTPIYHCNVHEDGELPVGALGLFEDEWKPSHTLFDFLAVLLERIASPDPWSEAAVRPDLAAQLKAERSAFNWAAQEHVRLHAMIR